jgi:hypothetical protein
MTDTTNPQADLPARLEAVLTERFTELGNPFSEMRRHEEGPDGWPASHPVGPHQVAEVLRELLAAVPVPASAPTDGSIREQLLRTLDFAYCQGLGYTTPEELVAAYDATRLPAPADRAALRDRIAEALRADACNGDCDDTEEGCFRKRIQPCVWHHGVLTEVLGTPEVIADAVLAVLPETTDQAAEIDRLRAKVYEWQGSYLDEAKVRQGRDAEIARLPVDRAAVIREAADWLDGCNPDRGAEFSDGVDWATSELRRLAAAVPVSGPGDATDETQQRKCTASISGDCLREAESETACDTEAGECVHGGRPASEAQQPETQAFTVQVWPLTRILSEVQCGSQDWTWDEEWADLDHYRAKELADLETQIKVNGITEPVLIGSDGRLWDGHHRLRLAVRLGIGYVPVRVPAVVSQPDEEA